MFRFGRGKRFGNGFRPARGPFGRADETQRPRLGGRVFPGDPGTWESGWAGPDCRAPRDSFSNDYFPTEGPRGPFFCRSAIGGLAGLEATGPEFVARPAGTTSRAFGLLENNNFFGGGRGC